MVNFGHMNKTLKVILIIFGSIVLLGIVMSTFLNIANDARNKTEIQKLVSEQENCTLEKFTKVFIEDPGLEKDNGFVDVFWNSKLNHCSILLKLPDYPEPQSTTYALTVLDAKKYKSLGDSVIVQETYFDKDYVIENEAERQNLYREYFEEKIKEYR